MDPACVDQMGSFFFVKAVQVRDVLEIVCIKLSALHYLVRLYIIVKHGYLKGISFFFQEWFCLLKDLGMRRRGCGYSDGGVFFCHNARAKSSDRKYACQSCCCQFFHNRYLLYRKIYAGNRKAPVNSRSCCFHRKSIVLTNWMMPMPAALPMITEKTMKTTREPVFMDVDFRRSK